MTKKVTFHCDICSEQTDPLRIFGVRFSDNHNFKLDGASTTDGKHLCEKCAEQIYEQFLAMQRRA